MEKCSLGVHGVFRNIPSLGGWWTIYTVLGTLLPLKSGNQTMKPDGAILFCTKAPIQSLGLGPVSQRWKKSEVWQKQAQQMQHET